MDSDANANIVLGGYVGYALNSNGGATYSTITYVAASGTISWTRKISARNSGNLNNIKFSPLGSYIVAVLQKNPGSLLILDSTGKAKAIYLGTAAWNIIANSGLYVDDLTAVTLVKQS